MLFICYEYYLKCPSSSVLLMPLRYVIGRLGSGTGIRAFFLSFFCACANDGATITLRVGLMCQQRGLVTTQGIAKIRTVGSKPCLRSARAKDVEGSVSSSAYIHPAPPDVACRPFVCTHAHARTHFAIRHPAKRIKYSEIW